MICEGYSKTVFVLKNWVIKTPHFGINHIRSLYSEWWTYIIESKYRRTFLPKTFLIFPFPIIIQERAEELTQDEFQTFIHNCGHLLSKEINVDRIFSDNKKENYGKIGERVVKIDFGWLYWE